VVVGQRDGAIQCVWWNVRPPEYPDPQELLDQQQPLEAAAVLAVRGDFAGAARLFEEHIEWRAAAEVWREAGQLAEAARCYTTAQDWVAALDLYRQANDRAGEARVLARQDKHAEAAAIYEELGDIDQAVREYVAAERIAYAAGLMEKAGRPTAAVELYQQAKQDDRAAEILIKGGHFAEAAELYQRLGKLDAAIGVLLQGGFLIDAAELNERQGRLRSAAELYEKAGKTAQALSLYERLQDWPHVAELAEGNGDLPRAAVALTKAGQLSRAAELFERAKQVDPALALYESLGLWDKVDTLARQSSQWAKQAYALLKKGLMSQAGEAYERAAEQAGRDQLSSEEVAQLYEEAAECYADEENWLKQSQCWKEVCRLRRWPYLRGQARVTSAFFEGEYNLLELLVQNNGAETARQIHVKSVSPKFMLDITETQEIRSLAPGQSRQLMLSLRPKPDVLGRTRLRIRLTYHSPAQREFEEAIECQVEVRSHDEKLVELSHPTPSPVTPGRIGYPPGGVVLAGQPGEDERAVSDREEEVASWQRQLAEARENLQVIEEYKAKFVQETDVPLQTLKEERRVRAIIAELEDKLRGSL
jgi:tetratricopeptide (TPR) repeat protein